MLRRFAAVACALAMVAGAELAAAGEFTLLSRTLVQGPARTLLFHEGNLILATGGGLVVFRGLKDLGHPAFLPVEGEPRGLAALGSIAYVATFPAGLTTVDLSDPSRPVEIRRLDVPQAVQCAIAGGSLYVSDQRSRLHLFALDDPREPRFVESRPLPRHAASIAAEGDLLAVVHARETEIFRAGSSGSLESLATVATPSGARRAIILEKVLCILTAKGEVLSWDLARADRPKPLGELRQKRIADIAAGDGAGALLSGSGFVIPFEIARTEEAAGAGAARIRVKKAIAPGPNAGPGRRPAPPPGAAAEPEPAAVFASRDRIAVIAPFDGMSLYALEGARCRTLGFFPTRGFAMSAVASNGLLYLANGGDGIRIASVGDDGVPEWIGHLQTAEARDVALDGTHLFIADGAGGIRVADVGDPRNPRLVGRHASPYYMSALAVRDGRAYCAGGLGGAEILDVSNPRRPRLLWRRAFSEVRGIDADDRYLYLADGDAGLRIYSLAGGEPRPVSTLDTPGWNCDVLVAGETAYLADGGLGIVAADISNRERPRSLGSAPTGAIARRIFLRGETLFAAAFTSGVAAIDVSDPARPAVAASFETVNDGRGVYADERFVYLASGSGGLYIFTYSR